MDRRRGTSPLVSSAVCAAFFLVVGTASAVPVQQPEDGTVTGATAGFGAVLWSVLDDCVGDTADAEPAMVCFKSKALTALDRALSKPTVTLVDGLALSVRSAKSLADPHAEQADRAALDSAKDPAHKNALLDDMLASRMDKLMTTRTIVVDGGQEGRGKKRDKAMQQAFMMAGMMLAAVMGPMAFKVIALLAGKALVLSKIALVLSAIIALKKLMHPQQNQEIEHVSHVSHSGWGRNIKLDDTSDASTAAQKMAYSAQQKQ